MTKGDSHTHAHKSHTHGMFIPIELRFGEFQGINFSYGQVTLA
jgi:hypothetical protein